MNYIWDVLLKADKENVSRESIKFIKAKIASPYMEITFDDLNVSFLPENNVVEVNEYYRFYEIFKELFNINFIESKELREVLLDILLHYLGELDLKQGLSKTEIHKSLLYKDILNEVFGENLANNIVYFTKDELDILLNGFITLYKTGTSIELFKKVLQGVFEKSIVYLNKDKPKDIYIYLDKIKTNDLESKIQVILDTFLPINMKPMIFWDKHFGIIGLNKTMKINEIVMID